MLQVLQQQCIICIVFAVSTLGLLAATWSAWRHRRSVSTTALGPAERPTAVSAEVRRFLVDPTWTTDPEWERRRQKCLLFDSFWPADARLPAVWGSFARAPAAGAASKPNPLEAGSGAAPPLEPLRAQQMLPSAAPCQHDALASQHVHFCCANFLCMSFEHSLPDMICSACAMRLAGDDEYFHRWDLAKISFLESVYGMFCKPGRAPRRRVVLGGAGGAVGLGG